MNKSLAILALGVVTLTNAACAVSPSSTESASTQATSAPTSVSITGTTSPDTSVPTAATASATTTAADDTWIGDLELIDTTLRTMHNDPFAVVPEAVWSARIDQLEQSFPTMSHDQRIVGFGSLVGLLDTHTQFFSPRQRTYEVWLYEFSDGWFVVAAKDASLVGAQLVSINGTSAADVAAAVYPLIPADNESAERNGAYLMADVAYLHGLGIVDDPAKPAFRFVRPDGSASTIDLPSSLDDDFYGQLHLLGSMAGDDNEAVRRRGEPIWSRVDEPSTSFLLSLNDYTSTGRSEAIAAMTAALDAGTVDRVVVDMRYLRGGNGGLLSPIVNAVKDDPRINRPGGLTVLIGRENESAATVIASTLDRETAATFVGEMTPARADNFLCGQCQDVELPQSGYVFSVPDDRAGNGDPRMAIEPDVPVFLSSVDYFAGRDPALDIALAG